MHQPYTKKIKPMFLLLIFFTIHPMAEQSWWYNSVLWNITVAATAFITGAVSYHYYQSYICSHEQFIKNCQSLYATISHELCDCHHFYNNDAQISDWDLKEMILHNNQETYPFMRYYTSLTKAAWNLDKNLLIVRQQLVNIEKHKKQLLHTPSSEITIHIHGMLVQLEIKGKELQKQIIKVKILVTILKNKIKLFKEYNDDYNNWSQQKRKILLQR